MCKRKPGLKCLWDENIQFLIVFFLWHVAAIRKLMLWFTNQMPAFVRQVGSEDMALLGNLASSDNPVAVTALGGLITAVEAYYSEPPPRPPAGLMVVVRHAKRVLRDSKAALVLLFLPRKRPYVPCRCQLFLYLCAKSEIKMIPGRKCDFCTVPF